MRPSRVKAEMNEAFADRFGRAKKKSVRRKERRARTIARETAWLLSVGIDPSDSEAPVA